MFTIEQLEKIQSAFNLLIENLREFYSAVYTKAREANVHPAYFFHEYFPNNYDDLKKHYCDVLELMNINPKGPYADHLIRDHLMRSIRPEYNFCVGNRYELDEYKSITWFNTTFYDLSNKEIKNPYLIYTGTNPELFSLGEERLDFFVPSKIYGLYAKNLRIDHADFVTLLNKIDLLRLYGSQKGASYNSYPREISGPGKEMLDLAEALYNIVEVYLTLPEDERPAAHQATVVKFQTRLLAGKALLKQDRNALNILNQIARNCPLISTTPTLVADTSPIYDEIRQHIQFLTDLHQQLKELTHEDKNAAIEELISIFEWGLQVTDNAELKNHFKEKQPLIATGYFNVQHKLHAYSSNQQTDLAKVAYNTLCSIITILAMLSIIGIPVGYYVFSQNLKYHDNLFKFFPTNQCDVINAEVIKHAEQVDQAIFVDASVSQGPIN